MFGGHAHGMPEMQCWAALCLVWKGLTFWRVRSSLRATG